MNTLIGEALSFTANSPLGSQELIFILILALGMAVVGVMPFWFICKKAGLSPWLSLLMIVPFGALVLPFLLAFIDWPALKERRPPQLP